MGGLRCSDLGGVIQVAEGKGIYLSNADLMIVRGLLKEEAGKGFRAAVAQETFTP